MPFIYSKTGSEIENQKLKNGPMQADGECPLPAVAPEPADKNCKDKGGEYCMDKTFLEIGWSKCGGKFHALVHPGLTNRFQMYSIIDKISVGEPKAGFGLEQRAASNEPVQPIKVKIESDANKW